MLRKALSPIMYNNNLSTHKDVAWVSMFKTESSEMLYLQYLYVHSKHSKKTVHASSATLPTTRGVSTLPNLHVHLCCLPPPQQNESNTQEHTYFFRYQMNWSKLRNNSGAGETGSQRIMCTNIIASKGIS